MGHDFWLSRARSFLAFAYLRSDATSLMRSLSVLPQKATNGTKVAPVSHTSGDQMSTALAGFLEKSKVTATATRLYRTLGLVLAKVMN